MMNLEIGRGAIFDTLLDEGDSEPTTLWIMANWAHNTQRFTYQQSAQTEKSWISLGTGGISDNPGGSTVYRATFLHPDTLDYVEITHPWVWRYLTQKYPERCSMRPDDALFVGTIEGAVYGGTDSGCPSAGDWGSVGPSDPSNFPLFPTIDDLVTVLRSAGLTYGYSVETGRDPTENLRVLRVLVAATGCESSGSYPALPDPEDPEFSGSIETVFGWASHGGVTATVSLDQISVSIGDQTVLQRTESNTWLGSMWSGWSLDFFTAGHTTGRSETYTRTGFDSHEWDEQAFIAILAELGVTL